MTARGDIAVRKIPDRCLRPWSQTALRLPDQRATLALVCARITSAKPPVSVNHYAYHQPHDSLLQAVSTALAPGRTLQSP
jgi:hypothetical protein